MMTGTGIPPKVTFVVPCFRLAHFLEECVESIVAQSCRSMEIIIMDDLSPDDTPAVAKALVAAHPDREILYVRNETNLGNIRNYNKGIRMARGEYVWILSPDDRLRHKEIVQKYLDVAEADPQVGYVFCPGNRIEENIDKGLHSPSLYRTTDQILDSRQLVKDIVDNNFELLSPSVMIRKRCYETVTFFPEDLPHRGDSYVWALIALDYKVAYFAEPMVDYRIHGNSMLTTLARESFATIIGDDVAVLWRMKAEAEKRHLYDIVGHSWRAIEFIYLMALSGVRCRGYSYRLSLPEFEASLRKHERDSRVRTRTKAKVLMFLADHLYWRKQMTKALYFYRKANESWGNRITSENLTVLAKLALLKMGKPGAMVRCYLGKAHRVSGADRQEEGNSAIL